MIWTASDGENFTNIGFPFLPEPGPLSPLFLDISNHIIITFQPTEFVYDNNQQFVFVYTLSSVL